MKHKIVLLVLLFALLAGCQESFDLSQVKMVLLQNPEGSFSISHAPCPRCTQPSTLDGGIFYPLDVEASADNIVSYLEASFSKRISGGIHEMYCRNCGLQQISFDFPTLSMEGWKR